MEKKTVFTLTEKEKNDLEKIISNYSVFHSCPILECGDFKCESCPIGKALSKLDEGTRLVKKLIENGYIEE